jgi:hypothetical protein
MLLFVTDGVVDETPRVLENRHLVAGVQTALDQMAGPEGRRVI